ncbi:NAD(P)-binding domain,Short-chain dehydrogenase/reductase, conserved site,Short-chain [Cinara cedri]|uniref:Short-chain dehydrogenase/reductase 3 n=1 Tax=Cinara cedri TaxID=506608 RepID=A0A5E4NDY5_9HEMI|nr:NAD(P)-binding domain,Short-chain dehydrogenase/reductase, conserved site,Short-chain [Cinara cedri]
MSLPSQPVKFFFELTFFLLVLLVPGILWGCLKNFFPAKRKSIKGQIVLITGAARGLGREIAFRFAELGAKTVCVDVDGRGNDDTARAIRETGGAAASYECDVTKTENIKTLHERVRNDVGPVDVLINNAGIVWGHLYVDPAKDQFIVDQMNVNLMAQIWMNREILPSMLERNSGHIVAISSLSSMAGVSGFSTYTITKWGTSGMMECLHNELKEFNSAVKTTNVLPYFVETNPKFSAKLHLRIPELSKTAAARDIVNGILEEKRQFSVPGYMFTLIALMRCLPDSVQTLINNIFYVRLVPDATDQLILNKYCKNRNTERK